MTGKNHWLVLWIFLFPQLLWGLEDQPDIAYDQLHLESLSKLSRRQAIKDFIRAHPKYAQAHYDLHRVLIEDHTPEAYQDAHRALKQALRLEPKNITYMIALGTFFAYRTSTHSLWVNIKRFSSGHPMSLLHSLALGAFISGNF